MAITGSVSSRVSLRGPLHHLEGLEGSDKEEEILGLGLGWAGVVLGAIPAEACFWRGDLGLGQRLKGAFSVRPAFAKRH